MHVTIDSIIFLVKRFIQLAWCNHLCEKWTRNRMKGNFDDISCWLTKNLKALTLCHYRCCLTPDQPFYTLPSPPLPLISSLSPSLSPSSSSPQHHCHHHHFTFYLIITICNINAFKKRKNVTTTHESDALFSIKRNRYIIV